MNAAVRSQSIEIERRRLAWRSLGSGPPLLLLNGYAATAADWDPEALAVLTRSFELICPDNRGVGDSQLGDPEELTIDAMAADFEALLDALAIERLPVVGWSMGGFVAQRLAARAPGRVAALGLLATDPGGPAAVRAEPRVWELLTDHSGTPREQATRLLSVLFPSPVAAEMDRQFGDLMASARAVLSPAALLAQEAAMAGWHDEDQPRTNADPLPVLVACGSEDVVIPPANAEALSDRWPGCRIERFPGGGHAFMAQEPQRLADLIASFLQATRAP